MRRHHTLTPLLTAALATTLQAGGVRAAEGQGAGVPLDKTPAKVQAAIKKQLPTAKATELQIREHFRDNGKKLFEVDWETATADVQVEIAEGGAVKKRRDRVPISQVPPAVIEASKKERREKTGVQVNHGMKIVEKDETLYELHFDNAEGRLKLRYEPDGTLVRRHQELTFASLPKPVAAAASKELGVLKPHKIARVTKSDGVSFRVEAGAGPAEIELKIAGDGKVLERDGPGARLKPQAAVPPGPVPGGNRPPAANSNAKPNVKLNDW